jgi:hypothetical protein
MCMRPVVYGCYKELRIGTPTIQVSGESRQRNKTTTTTTINTRWKATQRVMTAKLTRLSHKIVIQLHLAAESCTICSSRSRRTVRKLLDTSSYSDIPTLWASYRMLLKCVERIIRSTYKVISNCYGLDDQGSRVRFPAGAGNFSLHYLSRTALGPTLPPIQWVPGALFLGVKRPGREADYSPPSSAEVKNAWSYTSTPQYVFMAWCLVKHGDFTFTF